MLDQEEISAKDDSKLADGSKAVDESRRNLFKLAAAGSVASLITLKQTDALSAELPPIIYPPSPPVTPWQESIPEYVYRPKKSLMRELNPPPQAVANQATGDSKIDECGRDPIQRFNEFYHANGNNCDSYELHVSEQLHVFHPDYPYPKQPIWGYDGVYPGPTFHAKYGTPVVIRLFNELPAPDKHFGYGSPEISMHLHNLHTPSESDGFPGNYFSKYKPQPESVIPGSTLSRPGRYFDHCYPNVYAGYDKSRETDLNAIGDPREALGTLWYHDHTLKTTGANCVKGLVGAYLLFDKIDSGDENDIHTQALRLPSGDYDVPLMFNDMRFDVNGNQFYDQFSPEGVFGDMVVVAGKIKPFFKVARRKYRLRLINGGPTRYYEFYLVHKGVVKPFIHIANDGNLFEYPLMNQTKLRLAMSERGDIIVDFKAFPLGSEVFLVNRLRQDDTRGPKDVRTPGDQVLKFIVDREPIEPDNSRVLTATTFMRALPPIVLTEVKARRTWEFARKNGVWTVNDKIFEVNTVHANPKKGTAEIWTLRNGGGGWSHPVHIHLEEGRILKRNGRPPPPHERGRKDTYNLGPDETVEVFIRFRDFPGKYVMHCHNLAHEDHEMMIRFDVVD